MDLWVRSQNRGTLIKFEKLCHTDVKINAYFTNGNCELGTYKSTKRALEVLDEIQEYLKKMGKDEILTDKLGIMNGIKHYGIVYEMPKE